MASTLFDEEKSAMMMAMALIFPNFLLAGLIWPIESEWQQMVGELHHLICSLFRTYLGLPGTMQTISLFLPGTLACESKRKREICQSFTLIVLSMQVFEQYCYVAGECLILQFGLDLYPQADGYVYM